jgi:hypothetical protein
LRKAELKSRGNGELRDLAAQDAGRAEQARWAAIVVFVAILLGGGGYVITRDAAGFGSRETKTIVGVVKGPGASRRVTTREPAASLPPERAQSGTGGGPEKSSEKLEERPQGVARAKGTTEEHPMSFFETLIGDDGLVLVRLGAVILAAFVGAAISYRVVLGNYRFKVGSIDFSTERESVNMTAFVAALGDSIEEIATRMGGLEKLLAAADPQEISAAGHLTPELGKFEPRTPSAKSFEDEQAEALMLRRARSGLPPKGVDAFKEAIEDRRSELLRESGQASDRGPRESGQASDRGPRESDAEPETRPRAAPHRGGDPRPRSEEWVDAMEELVRYFRKTQRPRELPVFYPTILQSADRYQAICILLGKGDPIQAGVLVEPLFNDFILVKWLADNWGEREEVASRFEEHAATQALRGRWLQEATNLSIPTGFFEVEAQPGIEPLDPRGQRPSRTWWHPEDEAESEDAAVGLPGIIARLAAGKPPPPLAGTEGQPLDKLDRLDQIREWLSQFGHPSAAGLLTRPPAESAGARTSYDPSYLVGFSAAWLFTQELHLLADFTHESHDEIDRAWRACVELFAERLANRETPGQFVEEWKTRYPRQGEA